MNTNSLMPPEERLRRAHLLRLQAEVDFNHGRYTEARVNKMRSRLNLDLAHNPQVDRVNYQVWTGEVFLDKWAVTYQVMP